MQGPGQGTAPALCLCGSLCGKGKGRALQDAASPIRRPPHTFWG